MRGSLIRIGGSFRDVRQRGISEQPSKPFDFEIFFQPLYRGWMKPATRATAKRVELGKHIVVDPEICHGSPTFKGTRIMVKQVLDALARGESTEELLAAWGGRLSREAIAETVRLATEALLDHEGRLYRRARPLSA
jgi:uncharacterized protein (DUF433 family)